MMYLWHGIVIHLVVRYLDISGLFATLIMLFVIAFLAIISVCIELWIKRKVKLRGDLSS